MNKAITALAAALMVASSGAWAKDYYDGKTPLVCTIHELFQCDIAQECQSVNAADVNAPTHLLVDFKKKLVTGNEPGSPLKTTIENVETVDDKLIFQGIEDGQEQVQDDGGGWTVSITKPFGTMTVAQASSGAAFVLFGACAPND